MAASRIASSFRRVLRKYRYFILISIILFILQCFIASTLFTITSIELNNSLRIEEQSHTHKGIRKTNYNHSGVIPDEHGDSDSQPFRDNSNNNAPNSARNSPSRTIKVDLNGDIKQYNLNLKCTLDSKDVTSAIHRARTRQCRQQIADVACDVLGGQLFPKRLSRSCPLQDSNGGTYMGCYRDSMTSRDLSGTHTNFDVDNTPEKCWGHCLRAGFKYAGVQYGLECWCGPAYGQHGKLDDHECQGKCPGDPSRSECGGFKAQRIYSTGYGDKPHNIVHLTKVSKDILSRPARIVYVLTVNGRSLRQVKRLFKALYYANHYYYIHVDARQDYLYRELLELTDNFFNVRLTPWRMSTIWGGASLLQMLLRCMKDLIEIKDWNWDFFVNLSESDYPVKTSEALTAFLTTYKDYNFLKSHGRDTPRFIRKQGLEKLFHECDAHMWKLGDRKLPEGIRIDGGSDWVALNRKFCKYLIHSQDELVSTLKQVYKYTLLPAESFFHTVIQNSEYCTTLVDNNLRMTNWRRKQGCKCQHKNVVDWCGCSPNDFKPEDWGKLMITETRPIFFARKFEATISQTVINKLDAYLFGEETSTLPGIDYYWHNGYHFKDQAPIIEDAYYTFYNTFTRMAVEELRAKSSQGECSFHPTRILETHVLMHSDQYQGMMVLFEAACHQDANIYQLETYLKPQSNMHVLLPSGPIKRLKTIDIGTSWDPKEEIFRNFGLFVGPESDIGVRHVWGNGAAFTLSMVWIDAAQVIAASFDVPITEGSHTGFYKPAFKGPLRPGVWKVVCLIHWEIVVQVEFLVTPISHHYKQPIAKDQLIRLHNGPKVGAHYKDNRDFTDFKDVVQLDESEMLNALRTAQENGAKSGIELLDWIDDLTAQFWSVVSTCFVRTHRSMKMSCDHISLCQTTNWSSRSPDPKTEIGQIDPITGRLG